MIVQEMRLKNGWSQQQLADISGLNVRTVQRIEQGQSASLESFKALGAAFNVDFSQLQEDTVRNIVSTPEQTEVFLAFRQVRKLRGLYTHLISYVLVMSGLTAINLILTPHQIWFIFPLLGWGVGILSHAVSVLDILPWFGPEWERRQVEKSSAAGSDCPGRQGATPERCRFAVQPITCGLTTSPASADHSSRL